MERELKIKFEWREADKNLEKEERNKPVDLSVPSDLMGMETRSWKTGDVSAQNQLASSAPNPYRQKNGGPGRSSRPGGGGFAGRSAGRSGRGPSSSSRPGSSRSGPARRGQ
jgi:ATP-dependent RNA helicase RhlE